MGLPTRLALGLYRGLWTAAAPLARRHKRLAEGFTERTVLGGSFVPPGEGPLVWIQAASGGEAALVRALIREAGANPAFTALAPRFLCTTWTAQGLEVLKNIPVPTGFSLLPRYVPLDNPGLMQKAVALAKPACVALLETELWPGLMAACRESGVPLLVLNARMTSKSLSGYRLLRPILRDLRPDRVLAISPEDAARFAEIFGPEGIDTMPNIKFDGAALAPPAGPDPFALPSEDRGRIRLALASIRQEEEEALAGILPRIINTGAALAVAPRHMHRTAFWRDALAGRAVLRSELPDGAALPKDGVLIWDTFGDLSLLYAHVDAAFIGGSLAPLGGQNFLEAPALGAHALVGPHLENFRWVGEEIFHTGMVERVASAEALAATLERFAAERPDRNREAERAETRERFGAWLAPRTGGARAAVEAILRVLQV